ITDPETRRQMQERLGMLNQALQLFNPNEPNNVAPGRTAQIDRRLTEIQATFQQFALANSTEREAMLRQVGMRSADFDTQAHAFGQFMRNLHTERNQLSSERAFNVGPNGYG